VHYVEYHDKDEKREFSPDCDRNRGRLVLSHFIHLHNFTAEEDKEKEKKG
jgi:hypothetical protein